MEENSKCYEFVEIPSKEGLLTSIDATYIIHLKDNGRIKEIENQLREYQPSKTIYMVINQGYKKCEKRLYDQKPAYDLIDAFLQIFRHSLHNHYNNILILEDDFMFSNKIKEESIRKEIDEFITTKSTDKFVYYLGCIPYLQSVGFTNHNRLYLSGGTHACIYSKRMREHVLRDHKQENIIDWDVFNTMNILHYDRYTYSQPLCYQLFPETENAKHWFNPLGMADMIKYMNTILSLNTQAEPGYSYFYLFSKFLYILLLVTMCIIMYYILGLNGFQIRKQRRTQR